MFSLEKKSINWKDPKIKAALDSFLERKLAFKSIPEFANYINSVCGTNIALSTIRNRVYQEQKERRLVLQGMQQASGSSGINLDSSARSSVEGGAAPPDPEMRSDNFGGDGMDSADCSSIIQGLQQMPVMFKGDSGDILQAIAMVNDFVNMSGNNSTTASMNLLDAFATPGPSGLNPNSSINFFKPPKKRTVKDSAVILVDGPVDGQEEYMEYSSDEEEMSPDSALPSPMKFTPLPAEFAQHFDPKAFKVDMGSLKQLSSFVREKLEYIVTAVEIYPHHNSFISSNRDAFKRNLEVISQAGEYFDKFLSFEDDPQFFVSILSPLAVALTICSSNNTGMLDQFYEAPEAANVDFFPDFLPGCRLTKMGMNNLGIILNGILTEAEALIDEYEAMKSVSKRISKVKMMMLTLQFSRHYRLAGKFADASLISSTKPESIELGKELNNVKMIKLCPNDIICESDESEILPGTSLW